ncbi:PIG-L deacetylase family protein [Herpetosiphon llansteffanensis]|uniref:PIG-L deacetylase family protein n=1 Tax=Herpetosiphon llansteffanensis TaxID=2094568 RepID=UPI000D7C3A0E|nr:PIG-L family deacetylase [Herpetosiphon llansteffanensis]
MPTILSVWAHPDDEAFGPVGVLAQARAAGYRVVIITATHGERGDISPELEIDPEHLGSVRLEELHQACQAIGVDRSIVWDYPDGGLALANASELRDKIVEVLNAEQPEIVLTFGPDGIYGHPDHIAISMATTQAFAQYMALNPSSEQPRLYYQSVAPGSDRVINSASSGNFPDPLPATTIIDVSEFAETKRAALDAHATQRHDWQQFLDQHDWFNTAYLHRVYPSFGLNDQPETTLFA